MDCWVDVMDEVWYRVGWGGGGGSVVMGVGR